MDRYTLIVGVITILAAAQRLLREDVKFAPTIPAPWRGLFVSAIGLVATPVLDAWLNNANIGQAVMSGVIAILPTLFNLIASFGANKEILQAMREAALKMSAVVVLVVGFGGCAWLKQNIPVAVTYAEDAQAILNVIEVAERAFFVIAPNPDLEKQVDQGIIDAQLALDAGIRILSGASDLSQDQVDAAFADFRKAYASLLELLKQVGIVTPTPEGHGLMTARGIRIPAPLALGKAVSR